MTVPGELPGVARLRRRALVRRLEIAGVLLLVLVGLAFLWPTRHPGALAVPTTGAAPDPTGVARGALGAERAGGTVCFTVRTPTALVLLRLPQGWSASERLALLDGGGSVAATPGEQVVATGAPQSATRIPGCPQTGRVWIVTALGLPR